MIRTVKKIIRHVVKARMRSRMKAAIKKSGKAAAKAAGKTAVKAAVIPAAGSAVTSFSQHAAKPAAKALAKPASKVLAKPSGKTVLKAAVRSRPVRGFLVRKAARTLLHGAFALGVLYLVARYRAMKKQQRYKLRKAIISKVRPTVFAGSRRNESERRTVRSMHRKAADKEKD